MEENEPNQIALPKGFRLENYEIEKILGKGGFGITYLGRDTMLNRLVAIKELLPDGIAARVAGSTVVPQTHLMRTNWDWAKKSFFKEAQTLAGFNHPNIVSIQRMIETNGTIYIVMDYIDGESYEARLERIGKETDEASVWAIIEPLMKGLEYIHCQGVLHRDIKPGNILLSKTGHPVLVDFGSAREAIGRTVTMTTVLTPGYAPFEQYQEKGKQGPWTDIYSLGAVLARAITGEKPPASADRVGEDEFIWLSNRSLPGFSARFLQSVDWALRLKSNERPQSLAQWREGFQAEPAGAPPVEAVPASEPFTETPPPIPDPSAATPPLETPPPVPLPVQEPPPPVPGNAAPQPAKSSNPWPWVLASLLGLVVIAFASTYALRHVVDPEWTPGSKHPAYEHVTAGSTRGTWTPDPGYERVAPGSKSDFQVRWSPGSKWAEFPHISASHKEGEWVPDPGYRFVDMKSASDFRVQWRANVPHPNFPHITSSDKEGTWTAELGYTFPETGSLKVKWNPGKRYSARPNLVSGDQEGQWNPVAGYDRITPGSSSDFRVQWKPGSKDPEHPHIIAAETENRWNADKGYQFVNPGVDGDLRVKWMPGVVDEARHLKAGTEEDAWSPVPGYVWINPKDQDDKRVKWEAGRPHPQYPHIISASQENRWNAKAGYQFANPGVDGDLRVNWVPGTIDSDNHLKALAKEGSWEPAPGYRWLKPNDEADRRVVKIEREQAPAAPARAEYPVARFSNYPGYVISPFPPNQLIDVRGMAHGSRVRDPVSGGIFINP